MSEEIIKRAKNLKYKCDCCEEIAPGKYIMRNDKQTDNLIEAVYIIDRLIDCTTNLQQKVEQLENIRKEIKEYIEKNVACFKNGDMLVELNVDDLLNILNKGSESNV